MFVRFQNHTPMPLMPSIHRTLSVPHTMSTASRGKVCDAGSGTQGNEQGAMAVPLTGRCCGTLVEELSGDIGCRVDGVRRPTCSM